MSNKDGSGSSSPPIRVGAKRSAYAEAANPALYRVADAPLFRCVQHGSAAVLCSTAGKTGRNGRTAAIGATVLWLTCPHLNNMVARLERYGAVQIVADCLATNPSVMAAHVSSHTVYQDRVKSLLSAEQWAFFESHFVRPADPLQRKFGNAGVSHAGDIKCLHALLAQTLGGAVNPVGLAVLNYLLFLSVLIRAVSPTDESALRAQINSRELFAKFLRFTLVRGIVEVPEAVAIAVSLRPDAELVVTHHWMADYGAIQGLKPDVCERSLEVFVFLEGKPPRASQKNRLN